MWWGPAVLRVVEAARRAGLTDNVPGIQHIPLLSFTEKRRNKHAERATSFPPHSPRCGKTVTGYWDRERSTCKQIIVTAIFCFNHESDARREEKSFVTRKIHSGGSCILPRASRRSCIWVICPAFVTGAMPTIMVNACG